MMPLEVPSRPVWAIVYRGDPDKPNWRDQELISVTRETLRLSLSALRHVMSEDYYHNYGAAAEEIKNVLRAYGGPER